MRDKEEIRDYQLKLIEAIKTTDRILLAVDMGLGKTISCLTAIEESNDDFKKVLIVGPKRVAQETWPDEFNEWKHTNELKYTVIKGTPVQRLKCLEQDTRIYITNRENIVWLFNNSKIKFDTIIWDESSSLKGGSFTTKKGEMSRFAAACQFSARVKRFIALTGTPTPNGIIDIWGQIKAIDPENKKYNESLGSSKNKFCNKYFKDMSRDNNYQMWKPLDDSYIKIMNIINDSVIKMKSDDYIKLPDFIPINVNISLDQKELEVYNHLKDNLMTENRDIIAKNPAILINKLLQMTSGCIYKKDGTYNVYHTKKIEALKEIIDENPDENILLLYNYKHEKEQLKKYFKDIVFLKKAEDTTLWKNKGIKLFACHPASAGHGLNLQTGGSVMVWMSLFWSLELYQQSNKRLHRSGQINNVRCYHLLAKGTADEKVLTALKNKDITQEEIIKLIRSI